MTSWKSVIKIGLLIFIALTVLIQICSLFEQVKQTQLPDGKYALFFHATVRCPSCLFMERLTKRVMGESFSDSSIKLISLNYQSRENQALADELGVGASGVILLEKTGDSQRVLNLIAQSWAEVGNEQAFIQMLKRNIGLFLQTDSTQSEESNAEKELEPRAIPQDIQTELNWE